MKLTQAKKIRDRFDELDQEVTGKTSAQDVTLEATKRLQEVVAEEFKITAEEVADAVLTAEEADGNLGGLADGLEIVMKNIKKKRKGRKSR